MTWMRLPALSAASLRSGCPCCGARDLVLAPDAIIAVGFGEAAVTRDGVLVWSEAQHMASASSYDDYWTCRIAERFARADPDHDWRIVLEGALSGAVYQRHGVGRWVLVQQGRGFCNDEAPEAVPLERSGPSHDFRIAMARVAPAPASGACPE